MPSRTLLAAAVLLAAILTPLAGAQVGVKPVPKPRTESLLVRVKTSLTRQSPVRKPSEVGSRITTNTKTPAKNSKLNEDPPARPLSPFLHHKGPPRLPSGVLQRVPPPRPPSEILARKIEYTPANPNILARKPAARAGRTLLIKKPPAKKSDTLLTRQPPVRSNATLIPTGPERPPDFARADQPYPTGLMLLRNRLAKIDDPGTQAYLDAFDNLIVEREYKQAQELYRRAEAAEKARQTADPTHRRGVH